MVMQPCYEKLSNVTQMHMPKLSISSACAIDRMLVFAGIVDVKKEKVVFHFQGIFDHTVVHVLANRWWAINVV